MKSYIGHHTCSQGGGFQKVLQDAPFISTWPKEDEDDPRTPYLGEGYYFWEDDTHQAKKWGRQWYSKWYFILEATINTTIDNFLDLIGDKQQIGAFLAVCDKLAKDGSIQRDFTLGEAIEYMKKAKIFPWQIIRGRDDKMKQDWFFFSRRGQGGMYIGGNFIFCLVDKNDLILTNKKIIFKSSVEAN